VTAKDEAAWLDPDASPEELARRRWADLRWRALKRVDWPGYVLRCVGMLFIAYAACLVVLGSIEVFGHPKEKPALKGDDAVLGGVLFALAAPNVGLGVFIVVASNRMRQLRSYRLAVAAAVLSIVASPILLFCAPVTLFSIIPLVALANDDVRWGFRKPELPTPPESSSGGVT
jgi:hypothetical protein